MISLVAFGILIESVLICATVNPRDCTSFRRLIINRAPRFATILSTLRLSRNGLSNFAEVRPYTELMTVFSASDRSSVVISPRSIISIASFRLPFSMERALSNSLCLMATRASLISSNRFVYTGPKSCSAIIELGCIEATSSTTTFRCMPGSA